jgi:hypothetical protein
MPVPSTICSAASTFITVRASGSMIGCAGLLGQIGCDWLGGVAWRGQVRQLVLEDDDRALLRPGGHPANLRGGQSRTLPPEDAMMMRARSHRDPSGYQ